MKTQSILVTLSVVLLLIFNWNTKYQCLIIGVCQTSGWGRILLSTDSLLWLHLSLSPAEVLPESGKSKDSGSEVKIHKHFFIVENALIRLEMQKKM